ncbi:MAG: hypothetical protein P1U53_02055 [Sulfitobacter sp.]|nr:hypothetical protein [Sulfitobacter sp.]
MVETHAHFTQRLTKLGRKHRKMEKGYVNVLTRDGLIIAQPRRARTVRSGSGFKLIAMAFLGFFVFKAVALAAVGERGYADRLALMESGTQVEQLGAKALVADPLTQTLASYIAPVLK